MQAFVEFVKNHWFFAIPMFLMSFTAVALVIWRILLNNHAKTDMNLFLPRLQDVMSKEGVDGALKLCQAQPGVEPRKLYVAGLENVRQGMAATKRAMANVMELEIVPDLNFLLPSILAIAKIATMVGLLGTVFSMIGTFQKLGEAAKAAAEGADQARKAGAQAEASAEIGLALFATALGLMTAIPLVFAHVLFKAWAHNFETHMKNMAGKLLLLIQALKTGPPPQAAAATAAGVARPLAPAGAGRQ